MTVWTVRSFPNFRTAEFDLVCTNRTFWWLSKTQISIVGAYMITVSLNEWAGTLRTSMYTHSMRNRSSHNRTTIAQFPCMPTFAAQLYNERDLKFSDARDKRCQKALRCNSTMGTSVEALICGAAQPMRTLTRLSNRRTTPKRVGRVYVCCTHNERPIQTKQNHCRSATSGNLY